MELNLDSGRKVGGGSAVASAVANAKTPRAATAARSRTVLKMMATDGLVALAITVAKGDTAKEKALEDMVTDQPRNCNLRSKIAALVVDTWGYRHETLEDVDKTVATSQVRPEPPVVVFLSD